MATERDLLLGRRWRTAGQERWLAIDLLGGDRILELDDPLRVVPESPGAIVATPLTSRPLDLAGGGLALPTGLLWALLDPCRAWQDPLREEADRLAVETRLRADRERFRTRVAWWRSLEGSLRDACRALLRGRSPDLLGCLDLLDRAPVAGGLGPKQPQAQGTAPAPDVPEPDPLVFDPDAIYAWFQAPEGLGAFYGAGFHPRIEQAQMAREVCRALAQGEPLLAEAGTGVGKTLAYLVPLVAAVGGGDQRAVVSTHTRALQSQILEQDLPRLMPLLGERRFALLMGRSNYLCLRQRQAYLTRPVADLDDALRAVCFRLWLAATEHGLREELADHPLLHTELSELFDSADLCLPGLCYEGGRCFVQKARKQAREADLVVVNHALLLQDLIRGHTLLGEIDRLVVDEAHRLPAVVLDQMSTACGPFRLDAVEDLLGRVRPGGPLPERVAVAARKLSTYAGKGERAAVAAEDFGRAVGRVFRDFGAWWQALGALVDARLPQRGRPGDRVRVRDKDEAFGEMRPETGALLERLAEASRCYADLSVRTSDLEDVSETLEDDLAQLAQAGQLMQMLERDVHFLTAGQEEDWVTWLVPGSKGGVRQLGATLLESGAVLREHWQQSDLAPVMTSATLAVGEDYTHMLGELGLTRRRPPTTTVTCPSPFDYHDQVLFLTPSRFPAPDAAGFGAAIGDLLSDLAGHSRRKTMALFTSYHLLNEAARRLEDGPDTGPEGTHILLQQPRSATGALLEEFRRRRRALLLGTNTFWEGVDFPGEDLEILVVTKLPFLVPSDPWVEARCERIAAGGENPFSSFVVRDAVLRLRQGFGRLIRRETDRGVVILLDQRLHTKNYGVTFLGALPSVPVSFSGSVDLLQRIDDFFGAARR